MRPFTAFATGGLFLLGLTLAACSGNAGAPSGQNVSSPTVPNPNGFAPTNTNVPRSPEALSTNAPHTFHQYTIPNCDAQPNQYYCFPHGLAVGPDRLYYVLYSSNAVGSVSYQGSFGEQISTGTNPNGIAE